mmetsp:Transcript_58731/g.149029  ORF Transcript_58731/g.149029 Transcript_58731/m.149029 type:complete len:290 (+) Transcript_58731:1215-2084(+)
MFEDAGRACILPEGSFLGPDPSVVVVVFVVVGARQGDQRSSLLRELLGGGQRAGGDVGHEPRHFRVEAKGLVQGCAQRNLPGCMRGIDVEEVAPERLHDIHILTLISDVQGHVGDARKVGITKLLVAREHIVPLHAAWRRGLSPRDIPQGSRVMAAHWAPTLHILPGQAFVLACQILGTVVLVRRPAVQERPIRHQVDSKEREAEGRHRNFFPTDILRRTSPDAQVTGQVAQVAEHRAEPHQTGVRHDQFSPIDAIELGEKGGELRELQGGAGQLRDTPHVLGHVLRPT